MNEGKFIVSRTLHTRYDTMTIFGVCKTYLFNVLRYTLDLYAGYTPRSFFTTFQQIGAKPLLM